MNMHGINGPRVGPARAAPPAPPPAPAAATPKAAPAADRVELSEEARKLLQEPGADARQARMEGVRLKLQAGQLDTPANRARAAENLLRSGDLNRAGE